jgi:hypothetical protein
MFDVRFLLIPYAVVCVSTDNSDELLSVETQTTASKPEPRTEASVASNYENRNHRATSILYFFPFNFSSLIFDKSF